MDINASALGALFTGFKTTFNKALSTSTVRWSKIATLVPSSTGEELYAWLGAIPRFREWVGDRVMKKMSAEGYSIRNKTWEASVSVPRESIEDDQYGIYTPMVQMMGEQAAVFPDDLVFDLLENGFSKKCFDGKPFFSDKHSGAGKELQSNLSSAPLTSENYGAARAQMMSITDTEGKSLKIIPDTLVVPPALESTALRLINAELVAGGETNIYRGTAEVVVAPELTGSDTAWYLLCTKNAIKPFIYQERRKPAITQRVNPDSDSVFERNTYEYGADLRGNAGYSLWQLAYGSTGTRS